MDQHLGAGPEGVGADREDRVLALLVLAQLRAQPGEQNAQAERLGDVVVGPGIEAQNGVRVRFGRRQHDDRGLDAAAAHQPADLAAVHVGQADVEQNGVEVLRLGEVEGAPAVVGLDRQELLVEPQLLAQGLAQGVVVVDQQDLLAGHAGQGAIAAHGRGRPAAMQVRARDASKHRSALARPVKIKAGSSWGLHCLAG